MTKKKRILSLFLSIAILLSICPAQVFAQELSEYRIGFWNDFPGSGTQEDPYQIRSAEDLQHLAESVNAGNSYSGNYFTQTDDITLTGSWIPIGSEKVPFAGTYLGNSYTISGLSITGTTNYLGLFGVVTGGVDGVVLKGAVIHGSSFLGAIAGSNKNTNQDGTTGRITNCQIIDSVITGGSSLGGISGSAFGDISGCTVSNTTISGKNYVGGITGTLSPKDYPNTNWGRRITSIEGCIIQNSQVSGEEGIGGICGYKPDGATSCGTYQPTIHACFNDNTTVSGTSSVGGILGEVYHFYTEDYLTVSQCANTGSVTASEYAGGIVGSADSCAFGNGYTLIENCFNTGNITISDRFAGGICGGTYKTIQNCHNIGEVRGSSYAASICGCTSYSRGTATITSCYYLSGCKSDSQAKSLSAQEFLDEASFTDWDFQTVWMMNSVIGAPILQKNAGTILDKVVSCRIAVVDSLDGTPISGADIAIFERESKLGQTDETGTFYLKDQIRTFSNNYQLIISAPGYESFLCYLSDLKVSETDYADNLVSLTRGSSEDHTYVNAHIDFANNRYGPFEQRNGFNNAYWFATSDDTLWAYRIWEVAGDIGEIASLKFSDLLVFENYYELFITDYLITVSGDSKTLMRDKIFENAQAQKVDIYNDVIKGIIGNIVTLAKTTNYTQEEWEKILGEKYSSSFWELFLEKFHDPARLDVELNELFDEPWSLSENDKEVYNEFLAASVKNTSLQEAVFNDLRKEYDFTQLADKLGSDAVKKFADVCATAKVCINTNRDVFQVLFDTYDEMLKDNLNLALSFKNELDRFYAIATNETALKTYLSKNLVLVEAGAVWKLAFQQVFNTWMNNTIVSAINIPGFGTAQLGALIATYKGTYSLLDKLTKISGKGKLYQIMYYVAPVEAGMNKAMLTYGETLTCEKSEASAGFYDLAFSCMRDLNIYLFQTLYDYGALFDSTSWPSPSKVDAAAKQTMELAAICQTAWKTASCHGNILSNRYKISSVMCPVDVYLYDSEQNLLASIIDDEVTCLEDDSIVLLNCNGKKTFMYPADKDYHIEIIPRENGNMAYYIAEVDETLSVKRNVEFYDIPIQTGKTLTGDIPQAFDVEKQVYSLKGADETIPCDYDSNDVDIPVESINLSPSHLELTVGETAACSASVLPANATYRRLDWQTDDVSVATVNTQGVLTATGAGTTTITVTAGTQSATCTVTVSPAVCAHTDLTYTEAAAPDCVHTGNHAYWTCNSCGQVFKEDQVTLTTVEDETLPPNDSHDWAEATCTTPKTCRRNGCGLTEGQPLGHRYGAGWSADADTHWHTCTRCGDHGDDAIHEPDRDAPGAGIPVLCRVCGRFLKEALPYSIYDVNQDGTINLLDVTHTQRFYGLTSKDSGWSPAADVNQDGAVDITDLILILNHFFFLT